MVPHDLRDLCVVVDVCENSLADYGVLLHHPPLFERQSAGLFENPRRKSHLPDVVNEAAQMGQLLLFFVQPKACCDVPRIDGYCRGVTRRVAVPCVECGDECTCEGDVGALESAVHMSELVGSLLLFAVEAIERMHGERRAEEQKKAPRRDLAIRIHEEYQSRRVDGHTGDHYGSGQAKELATGTSASHRNG